MKLLISEAK